MTKEFYCIAEILEESQKEGIHINIMFRKIKESIEQGKIKPLLKISSMRVNVKNLAFNPPDGIGYLDGFFDFGDRIKLVFDNLNPSGQMTIEEKRSLTYKVLPPNQIKIVDEKISNWTSNDACKRRRKSNGAGKRPYMQDDLKFFGYSSDDFDFSLEKFVITAAEYEILKGNSSNANPTSQKKKKFNDRVAAQELRAYDNVVLIVATIAKLGISIDDFVNKRGTSPGIVDAIEKAGEKLSKDTVRKFKQDLTTAIDNFNLKS